MRETEQTAFAKINLTLSVNGRRADGYHEIETVFHRINLCDQVTIRLLDSTETDRLETGELRLTVSSDWPGLPPGRKNIAGQAAELMLKQTVVPEQWAGIDIYIQKRIPVAAGLAGGSADAAAVLHGLNQLLELNLTLDELARLGSSIGADVPFCLHSHVGMVCAKATGIGEQLTPLPGLTGWVVLVAPPDQLTAAAVYEMYDRLTSKVRPAAAGDPAVVLEGLAAGDLAQVSVSLGNELEMGGRLLSPAVGRAIDLFQQAATGLKPPARPIMSGSGPAIFGLFADRADAETVSQQLRWDYDDVFVIALVG